MIYVASGTDSTPTARSTNLVRAAPLRNMGTKRLDLGGEGTPTREARRGALS